MNVLFPTRHLSEAKLPRADPFGACIKSLPLCAASSCSLAKLTAASTSPVLKVALTSLDAIVCGTKNIDRMTCIQNLAAHRQGL